MKVLRLCLMLTALLLPPLALPVSAQDGPAAPQLRLEFPETSAIPGQPLSLRLTVLVPSFMPKPPVWPDFEAPNLRVRLPGRATNPTSQRVGGETWAGVTRRYVLSPMVPGSFALPPQEVLVTWQDTQAGTARQTVLRTDPIRFAGVLPEGAEGLDPFLAASDLTLTQEITGTAEMVPGDSLTRQLTAEVSGVSPMFLPPLLETAALPGLAAYPDAPQLDEREERDSIGGSRTERIAYVAEAGGGGTLPEVRLEWYDIDDATIKTAIAAAVELHVDGPPAERRVARDWRRLAVLGGGGVLALAVLALVLRRMLPLLRARRAARQRRWLASEEHAWRGLQRVLRRRDHAALRPALDVWAGRVVAAGGVEAGGVAAGDPRALPEVAAALLALGAGRYGAAPLASGAAEGNWQALQRALSRARPKRRAARSDAALPPLNPGRA